MDVNSLGEIVITMAILIEDAIAGAVVLRSDTPDLCTLFEVLPDRSRHFVFPSEEVDTITLADTT